MQALVDKEIVTKSLRQGDITFLSFMISKKFWDSWWASIMGMGSGPSHADQAMNASLVRRL